ncbi:hypothetical protein [Penaeicola halotolerans]|uniref:hypothetical protein n=1 Tax=Penaeicola halotolerans TaxID=2793196 RepID=UPI001CF8ECEF|nr:hypothetical protein [Penaeicola halotolerans]
MSSSAQLDILEAKVKHLLGEYQTLRATCAQLQQENAVLKAENNKKDQLLNDFQNQIKITKLVKSMPVENIEAAELKKRINQYIKEIDHIIAYLSE